MYNLRITFETIADPDESKTSCFNELFYSGKSLGDLYRAMENYVAGDPALSASPTPIPPNLGNNTFLNPRVLQHCLNNLFDVYQMHLYETTKDRSLIEYTISDEKQLWKFHSSLNPFSAKSRYKF